MSKELEFYTRNELADIFHVTTWTIDHWAKQGRLHPIRLGGRTLFYKEDVHDLVAQSEEQRAA